MSPASLTLPHLLHQSSMPSHSPPPSPILDTSPISTPTSHSPDKYPLPSTSLSLTLRVHRRYGKLLPHNPTISLLNHVESQLDLEIAKLGPTSTFGYGWVIILDKLQVFFNDGQEMTLGQAKTAVRGTREMMMEVSFRELGTREVDVEVWEGEKMLGMVDVGPQVE